jgi:uncharacterized membrane protein YfcA
MLLAIVGYLIIGALGGFLSGLLGIGGGMLVVPGLALVYHLQGMPAASIMHMAEGSSLASMIVSAYSSVSAHYRRGSQIWPIYRRMFVAVIIGTILGTLLASILYSRVLAIIFGVFTLLVALMMLRGFSPHAKRNIPGPIPLFGVSAAIGVKSGLLGLGGGVISVPFLAYCNVPMRDAVGVSTAVSLTVAVIGTLGFMATGWHAPGLPHWSTGYVYWPAVLGVVVASPIFANLGAMLCYRLPVPLLRKIFAVFLLLIGIQMLI